MHCACTVYARLQPGHDLQWSCMGVAGSMRGVRQRARASRLPPASACLHIHPPAVHPLSNPRPALPHCFRRATTVYLVQRRIDMLPKPLTEDICSLR